MTKSTGIGVMLVAVAALVAMIAGCGSSSSGKPSASAPATMANGAPNYASSSNWLAIPQTTTKKVDVFYLRDTSCSKVTPSSPNIGPIHDPRHPAGRGAR
jgi:hypothetical protein